MYVHRICVGLEQVFTHLLLSYCMLWPSAKIANYVRVQKFLIMHETKSMSVYPGVYLVWLTSISTYTVCISGLVDFHVHLYRVCIWYGWLPCPPIPCVYLVWLTSMSVYPGVYLVWLTSMSVYTVCVSGMVDFHVRLYRVCIWYGWLPCPSIPCVYLVWLTSMSTHRTFTLTLGHHYTHLINSMSFKLNEEANISTNISILRRE